MMSSILALDVGSKRIGIARANTIAKIAEPLVTVEVNDEVVEKISDVVKQESAEAIVVGLPRNMSGEETKQSAATREFVESLQEKIDLPFHFQDESLTSVQAHEHLSEKKKGYNKADVDAQAAVYILEDYLKTLGT